MDDFAKEATVSNDKVIAALGANRYSEANKEFHSEHRNLVAKAKEAMQWQESLVAENEVKRKETSSTMLMALIVGGLFAGAAAVFGGVVLTRGIATPLRPQLPIWDESPRATCRRMRLPNSRREAMKSETWRAPSRR